MAPTDARVTDHAFLKALDGDAYYPDHLVAKGKAILLTLCERIETERPPDLETLYALTRVATEAFNALDEELWAAGSEIETFAREVISEDFWFVASTYGFPEADLEALVAARDW
ncbi:DUF5713 family protein [Thermomonospora umbrina]|uniref:Uncharacterized protein n=1 Tax=Thermomonospora umbrina TaxID=111806 RepID=A0A3D9SWS4_9ACTN|nr:DUF5713 family protein [Thermomonospora umbrina]REF00400.1 hypothetical protein DFJ69_5935 [Thermomonospora umbrina]